MLTKIATHSKKSTLLLLLPLILVVMLLKMIKEGQQSDERSYGQIDCDIYIDDDNNYEIRYIYIHIYSQLLPVSINN
jgi:hypothetical protein